jgi:hypothetical protein
MQRRNNSHGNFLELFEYGGKGRKSFVIILTPLFVNYFLGSTIRLNQKPYIAKTPISISSYMQQNLTVNFPIQDFFLDILITCPFDVIKKIKEFLHLSTIVGEISIINLRQNRKCPQQ